MAWISNAINIFAIILVLLVFYITYISYNQTGSTFKDTWSSTKQINKTLTDTGPVYGDVGTFVGQDWQPVDCILIKDADKQDDLSEFITEGKPNYVGTSQLPGLDALGEPNPPDEIEEPLFVTSLWNQWMESSSS